MNIRVKQLLANLLITALFLSSMGGVITAATTSTTTVKGASFTEDDLDATYDKSTATSIKLLGDTVQIQGGGATAQGSTVKITKAGTYIVEGNLNNGQIYVEAGNKAPIQLVLENATITNKTSSPIYVVSADKLVLTLAAGTKNVLTDSAAYVFPQGEDEPDAVIFSKDNLTINGAGTLTVNANYKHGIVGKDSLKIVSGTITINAVGDGLKGTDMIGVKSGNLTIQSKGDGMQSSKGFVDIQGGVINIQCENDGIQAETDLLLNGGDININAGGGSTKATSAKNVNNNQFGRMPGATTTAAQTEEESAKGLKAEVDIYINAGSIIVDSRDDAVHTNGSITQNGGTLAISTGDDGMHANVAFVSNGGEVTIAKSYESIESTSITFNNGYYHITSSDDGINAAPTHLGTIGGSGATLAINSGYIFVSANGDGVDINGSITATSGTLIVNGPTSSANSAIDYDGTFTIEGGLVVAAGSSGMAQAPSSSSSQRSLALTIPTVAAGTIVHIESEDGSEIVTFKSTKPYQSLIISSPLIKDGVTYAVYQNGTHTGVLKDGIYTKGTYTLGTKLTTATTASATTNNNMMAPGGFGGRGGNMTKTRPTW